MREQSKAAKRRFYDGAFLSRYFVGRGVDVGGRPDPLSDYIGIFPRMESVRVWDLEDGDAQYMAGVADGHYDFLHSSHCLEHMVDVKEALRNWIRVVRPGGHLIITIPDEDLYEQGVWPSRFNGDHKWTFTIHKRGSWSPRSINVLDLAIAFSDQVEVERIQLQKDFFREQLSLLNVDQTGGPVAESAIEVVLRKRTGDDDALLERTLEEGRKQHQAGNLPQAEALYKQVLRRKGEHPGALHLLGVLACQVKKYPEGEALINQAIAIRGDEPSYYANLAVARKGQRKYAEAVATYRKAIELKPDYAEAWYNLGIAWKEQGRAAEAIDCYQRAIELVPDYPEAHWNLALALLASGRYREGWREFEWRFRHQDAERAIYPFQLSGERWDGAPFAGKRLLIHDEQGFGDSIQMVRLLGEVKALGGEVIYETRPELARLFAELPGADRVVVRGGEPRDDFDLHVPIMSLPLLCRRETEASLRLDEPYLRADAELVEQWRARLRADGEGFRVGVVWAGNPIHPNDALRSLSAEALAPLAGVEGVRLYSLMKARDHAQPATQPPAVPGIIDHTRLLHDFADTAALVEALDLVISVDTAVAHLAGALGKPVWLLLPEVPDWRWLLERDDTPWYASMRIFRQPAGEGWAVAVEAVRGALAPLAADAGDEAAGAPVEHSARPPTRPIDALFSQRMLEAIGRHRQGDEGGAESIYRQLLEEYGESADLLHLLGVAVSQRGEFDEGERRLRRALELSPGNPEFYANLGNLLRNAGRLEEAVDCYRRVLAVRPEDGEANFALGNIAQEAKRFAEAERYYRRAIAARPEHIRAHNNLGVVLKDMGRVPEAIEAYRGGARIDPEYPDIHSNLGNALRIKGELGLAVESYRRAIELRPEYAEAYNNMGVSLKEQGRLEEALESYERAIAIQNNYHFAHSNRLFLLHYRDDYRARLAEGFAKWREQCAPPPDGHWFDNPRDAERPLRIGFVSPDLRRHSVAYFIEPVFRGHDREAYQLYAYSDTCNEDAVSQRLREAADHWYASCGWSDQQLVERIREDGIDILVDLTGHTAGNRMQVFARRAAPLQVTYLGYPGSTGLESMDYRLSDGRADPDDAADEQGYSETLLRLPESFLCFEAPEEAPAVTPPPMIERGSVTFGSFNNLAKLTDEMVVVWAEILKRVPGSQLILKYRALTDEGTRRRFEALFQAQGIEPERLRLYGRIPAVEGHLGLYGEVDVALDTYPYHGTTTTCEALWMGVPVITRGGEHHVSRVGVTLLGGLGLDEMIAADDAEYIDKAVALAGDASRLSELRDGMRERMRRSALMDEAGFNRALEATFRTIWTRWVQGA